MLLFVLLGIFLGHPSWVEAYDYGRILSPLLVLMALESLAPEPRAWFKWLPLAPLCMVVPRCALQLASQALAVLGVTASARP
jgi:hypothetical protein